MRAIPIRWKLPLHLRKMAYPIVVLLFAGTFLISEGRIFGQAIAGHSASGNHSFYFFAGFFNMIFAYYLCFYHRFLNGPNPRRPRHLSFFLSRYLFKTPVVLFYLVTSLWMIKSLGPNATIASSLGVCLGLLMLYTSNAVFFWLVGVALPLKLSHEIRRSYFILFTVALVLIFTLQEYWEPMKYALEYNPFIGLWFHP